MSSCNATIATEQSEAARWKARSCRQRAPTPPRFRKWERQDSKSEAGCASNYADGSTTCSMADDASSQSELVGLRTQAETVLGDEAFLTKRHRDCFQPANSRHMQDLSQFKQELMQPLRKAVYLFSGTDRDLMIAVINVISKATALVQAAASAHRELAFFREQVTGVLMRSVHSERPVSCSASVEAFLAWHAAWQQDVIPTYFALLWEITSLKDCADLVLDDLHMSTSDAAQQASKPIKTVSMAVAELEAAADVLRCSSDSWLALEQAHLCLGTSAQAAMSMQRCQVQEAGLVKRATKHEYLAFCKSLEGAAQNYGGDRKQDE